MHSYILGVIFLAASLGDVPQNACKIDRAKSPSFDSAACDAAIADATDPKVKSGLIELRAYARDEKGSYTGYMASIDDLNMSLALDPKNAAALHERAYIFNELGEYAKAESDLNAQAALTPDQPQLYQERALSRFLQGELEGAFEDRDRNVKLTSGDAGALIARARILMWLGRFSDAERDIEAATVSAKNALDPDTLKTVTELRNDLERWTKMDDASVAVQKCHDAKEEEDFLKETFVGDCTYSFLHASTGAERADALTQRYSGLELWKQQRDAGLDDLRLAYAFDPQNPDRQFNLGSLLVSLNHNHEALRYLDMSLAIKPSYYGYAAKAGAEEALGDSKDAFADAKKSFEMRPNDLALTILGDLSFDVLKDKDAAKKYWIGAYHLGDRDDGLKARLGSVGVSWPPPDDVSPDTQKKN